ncbi:hypothetical protein EON81_08510 [bacterium]|nr:MAG: hypothetical protein EON81_08510 [bacterium]
MISTVTPRQAGAYVFGYDTTWSDHGDERPTLTLDLGTDRKVSADGTFEARMAHVLERKISLRLGAATWIV